MRDDACGRGTHNTPAIKRWLVRHPRFQLHFTPTGGSWLNLVERWFALLTERQLRRGTHRSTRELEDAIRTYAQIAESGFMIGSSTKPSD